MSRLKRLFLGINWLRAAALALLLLACEEFSTEAPLSLEIQQAEAWPDTLVIAEIANLTVEVRDPQSRAIVGAAVAWGTSDSTVLQVSRLAVPEPDSRRDTLESQLTASLCAHAPGTAEVIVEVRQAGLEPTEYRAAVVVSRADWPAALTVTESDTVAVTLTNVEGAAAEPAVEWRSSDTGVLKVSKLGALGAIVTAHARGTADVIVAVGDAGQSQAEFTVPITVGPLEIQEASAWPDTLTTALVDTVAVTIANLEEMSAANIEVVWASSNAAVLEVTKLDSLSAIVTAVGRGSAEVIARVDEAGFEAAEYRKQVLVLQGWRDVGAGGGTPGEGVGPHVGGEIQGHTCGVTTAGEVYCWGGGSKGQLGTGASGQGVSTSVPLPVFTGVRFGEVVAGQFHNCACSGACREFTSDQVVFCWGWNSHGQIGAGLPNVQPVPVPVPYYGAMWSVSAGGFHSCGAVNRDLWSDVLVNICWGFDGYGQLGEDIDSLFNLLVNAGVFHTCGITTDEPAGIAYCWGRGTEGQLGDGNGTDQSMPVPVAGGVVFTALSPGGLHTCGIASDGQAYCWGSNTEGQLGDGSTMDRLTPAPVVGGLTFRAISAGGDYPNDDGQGGSQPDGSFTCGLTLDGTAYCWGKNSYGQLGDGTRQQSSTPVPVAGNHTFLSLTTSDAHACGVTSDQAIYCWGSNVRGQLGVDAGAQGFVMSPVRVTEPEIRR